MAHVWCGYSYNGYCLCSFTYDGKERKWQRKGLETVLCGLICLGCVSFSTYMGWDSSLNGFIGACVGFLGVDFIRDTARKLVNKKVD